MAIAILPCFSALQKFQFVWCGLDPYSLVSVHYSEHAIPSY